MNINVDIRSEESVKEALRLWSDNFDEMLKRLRNTGGFMYGYEADGIFTPYGEPDLVVHDQEYDDTTVEEASERYFFEELIKQYPHLIPSVTELFEKIITHNKSQPHRTPLYGSSVPFGVNAAISLMYLDPGKYMDIYIRLQQSFPNNHRLYREYEILDLVDDLANKGEDSLAVELFAAYCIPLATVASENIVMAYGELGCDHLGGVLVRKLLESESPDVDVRNLFFAALMRYACYDDYHFYEALLNILGIDLDINELGDYLSDLDGELPQTIDEFMEAMEKEEDEDLNAFEDDDRDKDGVLKVINIDLDNPDSIQAAMELLMSKLDSEKFLRKLEEEGHLPHFAEVKDGVVIKSYLNPEVVYQKAAQNEHLRPLICKMCEKISVLHRSVGGYPFWENDDDMLGTLPAFALAIADEKYIPYVTLVLAAVPQGTLPEQEVEAMLEKWGVSTYSLIFFAALCFTMPLQEADWYIPRILKFGFDEYLKEDRHMELFLNCMHSFIVGSQSFQKGLEDGDEKNRFICAKIIPVLRCVFHVAEENVESACKKTFNMIAEGKIPTIAEMRNL